MPLTCRRCGKPGHFARYCPQGLEVRYLSSTEQEELLLQLLAAKDAVGDPSPDAPPVEPSTKESTNTAVPSLDSEEDFQSSNPLIMILLCHSSMQEDKTQPQSWPDFANCEADPVKFTVRFA
ncbi:hypothetical protein C0993_001358 [Termitomyces sp. T159_Od127]|nr:hypothetical protein C0993_001358 [Termitomyces sp. T159_Od127]